MQWIHIMDKFSQHFRFRLSSFHIFTYRIYILGTLLQLFENIFLESFLSSDFHLWCIFDVSITIPFFSHWKNFLILSNFIVNVKNFDRQFFSTTKPMELFHTSLVYVWMGVLPSDPPSTESTNWLGHLLADESWRDDGAVLDQHWRIFCEGCKMLFSPGSYCVY